MEPSEFRDAVLEYARMLARLKAKQLAMYPGFKTQTREDIEQTLLVLLFAKSHLYDPLRASPRTFAARVIESGFKMLIRDSRRLKRGRGVPTRSLDDDRPGPTGRGLSSSTLSVTDHARRLGLSPDERPRGDRDHLLRAVRELPEPLRDTAFRLSRMGAAAIARATGRSRRQVNKDIELIREHLRRFGFGEP